MGMGLDQLDSLIRLTQMSLGLWRSLARLSLGCPNREGGPMWPIILHGSRCRGRNGKVNWYD